MKVLFFIVFAFAFLACGTKNTHPSSDEEIYHLPAKENVHYNQYDSTDLVNGDKVYLTKFDAPNSDSFYMGKSTTLDIIKIFGDVEISSSLEELPTTTENHYITGKYLRLAYEKEGLVFSFYRRKHDNETSEALLNSTDSCFLESILLRSPSNYYLDNVFIGMPYDAIIKKFGIPSFEITNGMVYRRYGLWLTFDKDIHTKEETVRLKEVSRSDRAWYIQNNYPVESLPQLGANER